MPSIAKRRRRNRTPPPPYTSSVDTNDRVMGIRCKDCGFQRLPDGRCGVCEHSKRIKAEMAEMAEMEGAVA